MDIMTALFGAKMGGGGGGASSWNDLAEKTAKVGGETLTWDGNADGRVTVEVPNAGGLRFVKISNAVVSLDDCVNGVTIVTGAGDSEQISYETISQMYAANGTLMVGPSAMVVEYDNKEVDISGGAGMFVTLPEAGIYAAHNGSNRYPASLTLPGYTGFVTEQTVVTPIPTEYLPEHLQFGTETKVVEGDTLVWDGNTEGHPVIDLGSEGYCKVSDAVLSTADFANGVQFTIDGGTTAMTGEEAQAVIAEVGFFFTDGVGVIPTDNFNLEGIVFPEKGIYFSFSGAVHVSSLTIPGYGKFVSEQTVTTPLDEKYMPILTSPGGKKFKISVDDSGTISAVEV